MSYPESKDIERHKKSLWTSLIQHFSGYVPMESVETALRSLMGDAALWVHNNHKKLDIDKVKQTIAQTAITTSALISGFAGVWKETVEFRILFNHGELEIYLERKDGQAISMEMLKDIAKNLANIPQFKTYKLFAIMKKQEVKR